ncbi:MAG: HAD family hydrolase, partial [Treponema sp.]|nr:HAD family hydrolase [Treponema sp.]
MFVEGLGEIKAVGFDIDGTLYRPYHLHARMAMHFFRYNQFFLKYGRTRHVMHGMERQKDFSKKQAEILSKKIGCTVEDCEERLSRIVYDGLAKFFPSIPSCKYVKETFQVFHEAGLKIALLSDFPPEQKGELWG